MEENRDKKMAKKIALRTREAGGRSFFVGGYVRDRMLGKENKDIDIEVHGISVERLEQILDELGERIEMGASFGVFGLRGYHLDIAMPRKETATGRGHKDFEIFVDPFLGTRKAALRRDFTINAMMMDVLSGEIIDHFGGLEDMRLGILRHVNDTTFVEDPLRVMRAAQFAARFGFEVAKETVELAKTMDLKYLASERIYAELEKAFLKAERPSVFFEELRKMNQLGVWFRQLEDLIGVEQDRQYHPEGDVWNHTMYVIDEAAKLKAGAKNPVGFLFAALCHDFGKAVTTEKIAGRIHAYSHETEGVPLAEEFLKKLTREVKLRKYVLNMVKLHMKPYQLASQNAKIKSTNKLFDEAIDPEGLLLLVIADHMGGPGRKRNENSERFLEERLKIFHEVMAEPYVMGADLVEAGLKPGPEFHEILDYAHKLRLARVKKPAALKQTLAYARQQFGLKPEQN